MTLNRFPIKLILLVSIILVIYSCSTTKVIKPLVKNEKNASFNFGGPLIGFSDITIPIPLTSISGAYGIDSFTTAFVGLQTTSLIYGLIQSDIGLLRSVIDQNKYLPGITLAPSLNFMYDKWEGNFRCYPQFDVNFYWNYLKSNNYFYTSINNWFELRTVKAHGEKQKNHWIPAICLGHTFVRPKMNYSIEAKYIAPFNSNQNIIIDYKSPVKNGTTGIYLSLIKKF